MTELQPTTRQKVNAILRKHHTPAQKVKDRISWHWWNGFRVAEPEPGRIEVYHETEFNFTKDRLEEEKMLAEYHETLRQAGIRSFVVRGDTLLVAGIEAAPVGRLQTASGPMLPGLEL